MQKHILLFVLGLMCLFVLCSCGRNSRNQDQTPSDDTQSTKSYTSEEISAIEEWWSSATVEAETGTNISE